jgi:gas vesicle protein GvpK
MKRRRSATTRSRPPARSTRKAPVRRRAAKTSNAPVLRPDEIDALRSELERSVPASGPSKWNANPEDAQRAVAKLVLTLMEFLRKLLERQAIRRMERRTLTPAEVEAVGVALMRLEETIRQIGARFGLTPEDLNLDLGPLGRLT